MAQLRRRGLGAVGSAVILSIGLLVAGSDARADRIMLRGGGQIRGKVVPDPKHPERVTVLTERGKTPLSFQKAQVIEVVAEPSALDEYVSRKGAIAATAQSNYDLGLWCEQNKLPDLAELHYAAALNLDKSFAPSHQKLGHVKYGDRWLTGDELREAQGLVKYHGKWITREEKEQRDKDIETATEQASWARRIRMLRESIAYGADDRRREAETQLMEIRDPAAVAPLVKVLGSDAEPIRILLAHVLGMIPGAEASSALVSRLLAETDFEVRHAIMDELQHRKDPGTTKLLVRALHATAPEVVNRAAWGLANLKAVATVPSLIGALVTTRTEMVMAPSAGGPAEGASITASFGGPPPTYAVGAAPIAYNGSSAAYLTGPVVGPGVAAFGATSVPLYPLPPNPLSGMPGGYGASLAGTGISAGGGVTGSRGPAPRMVTFNIQNVEVLSALVKLTGEDFGYDVNAWKRWVRSSFQPDTAPARRVPQP